MYRQLTWWVQHVQWFNMHIDTCPHLGAPPLSRDNRMFWSMRSVCIRAEYISTYSLAICSLVFYFPAVLWSCDQHITMHAVQKTPWACHAYPPVLCTFRCGTVCLMIQGILCLNVQLDLVFVCLFVIPAISRLFAFPCFKTHCKIYLRCMPFNFIAHVLSNRTSSVCRLG